MNGNDKMEENVIWRLIEKIIRGIFGILHIRLSEKQWENLLQFVRFGIVGLSNTLISYVIYVVSLWGFQKNGLLPEIDYLVAQVIAFILSVLWSFYWNNKFVFKKKENESRNIIQALLKTYVSYAFTGLFLNSILSILWMEIIGISKMFAPIINLLVSVPLNFVINKFWAFRSTGKSENKE